MRGHGVECAQPRAAATVALSPGATCAPAGKWSRFPPNVDTYWFHHRCYIAKATDNFLMPSRTGIEFIDPETIKLGHQSLGPRRLPLRRDAREWIDLRPAAQLRVLS